jgi:hypothetical protein
VQDHGPARSAALGQKDEGVEPDTVAHGHHGMGSASAGMHGSASNR